MSGCNGEIKKAQFTAETVSISLIAPGVYQLILKADGVEAPECGQFYMLRREPSKTLLCRPISVFRVEDSVGELCFVNPETLKNERSVGRRRKVRFDTSIVITFLILVKGQGTQELCSLKEGDLVSGIGPLGNSFPMPPKKAKTAIIGGGIGVAPVAGFASTLPRSTYDFYACFKTGHYGLNIVDPSELIITTDDGSEGVKGMLPDVFDAATAREYDVVYACGPEPMLRYVQKVCREAETQCWLSMESRMACGVGACLGCTVQTTEGNRRCCKDGPVFDGATLIFPERPVKAPLGLLGRAEQLKVDEPEGLLQKAQEIAGPDLSVKIAGVRFRNPVIAASGTFGYGSEYEDLVKVNSLGGICSKGLTLEPRAGNTGNRLVETPSALINSIGLENPGIPHFIEHELPAMLEYKAVTLANLSGSSEETYVEGAKLLDATAVPMIELNISCPNVKCGGMAFGLNPDTAAQITAAVRAVTKKPLVVKLSPNAPDLVAVADAVRKAGADAISLVNTFQATAINIETGRPVFDNIRAGLSGPGIKPIALRMVMDVCQAMKALPKKEQIPVIGLGGISTWQDAVEFIMAGASAIEVGTATFADPACMNNIVEGLRAFMGRKGYKTIKEMRGIALK